MTYSSSSMRRLASSSALITPSIGRSTGLAKMFLREVVIRSDLVVQNVKSTVIFVVMQQPEEIEGSPRRCGVSVAAGKEQDCWLVFGGALEVVEHIVRAD